MIRTWPNRAASRLTSPVSFGHAGTTGNCQVAVFLGYAGERGHALVDRALYLPRRWTEDGGRCRAAGVPEGRRSYQSKTELALKPLRQAR